MARKRMLDSEIWRDRKVVKLSNEAFILWIAIISMADDEGIFEYDPDAWFYEIARKDITAKKISAAMQEIIDQEMVVMYEDRYGFIPAWYKHQVLSHATRSKNKRPPAGVVKLYPEYISSWVKTFTTYRKTPEGDRESIVPEYPFRELNGAIPDDCGIIPENSGEFQKTPGSIDQSSINKVSIVKSNSSAKSEYSLDFITFYDSYPRKEGKTAANKAFLAKTRQGASLADILSSLVVYKAQIEKKHTAPEYIKLPATFLNCFEDYKPEPESRPVRYVFKAGLSCPVCHTALPAGGVRCPNCHADHLVGIEEPEYYEAQV